MYVVAFLNRILNLFQHEIPGSVGPSFGSDDIDIAIEIVVIYKTVGRTFRLNIHQVLLEMLLSTESLSKYVVRELPSIADISLSSGSAHLSKIIRN